MTNAPDTIEMIPLLPIIEKYARESSISIDIGVCKATGSTRYILKGMESRVIDNEIFIGIDHKDQREDWFELKEWQHYILGDSQSQSTVNKCKKILGERKADLIMIDTIHEYDFIKKELELWKQLAHDKTVWLFHDTWMFGPYNHMTDAIKEFAALDGRWEYIDITKEAHGLGALIPKKQ
jgi:hypothetical protein